MCGEQTSITRQTSARCGSSPRVRGTVLNLEARLRTDRFIPACAGNRTIVPTAYGTISGSSPRVRGTAHSLLGGGSCQRFIPACAGNRAVFDEQLRHIAGSSPRVRGTDGLAIPPTAAYRFIPACAGNRGLYLDTNPVGPVHPRVCGEQQVPASSIAPHSGSSPRVRGTGALSFMSAPRQRFILACAGNRSATRCVTT